MLVFASIGTGIGALLHPSNGPVDLICCWGLSWANHSLCFSSEASPVHFERLKLEDSYLRENQAVLFMYLDGLIFVLMCSPFVAIFCVFLNVTYSIFNDFVMFMFSNIVT